MVKTSRWIAVASAVAILAALLAVASTGTSALADEAGTARGYAYGIAQEGPGEDELQPAPEAEAEVPPPNNASDKASSQFDEEQLVGLLMDQVVVSRVRADACIQPGVQEKLQEQENRAEYLANGGTGNNAPAERTEVFYAPGFPNADACLTPVVAGTDSPSGPPSPSPTTSPTPPPAGTAQCSDGQDNDRDGRTDSQDNQCHTDGDASDNDATYDPNIRFEARNCEDVTKAQTDPGTAAAPNASFTGVTCLSTLPLWNARGYTRTVKVLTFEDLESEAVARCEDNPATPDTQEVVYSTAAKYGNSGQLVADPSRPNQNLNPLKLGLTNSALVTYWETNWDPTTNSTVDGSDTVWVNALHIRTPLEDIIIGHAEATATCVPPEPVVTTPAPVVTVTPVGNPTPTPPPGGFPRDVDLEPSREKLRWGSALTFNGSVTPNAQFETPRFCVENVPVTIRRDIVGGVEEFRDMGTVQTDRDGQFSFNYTADISANWVAHIDKDVPKDCAQASSEQKTVLVAKRPLLRISDTSVRKGQTVKFTISFEPCEGHEGDPVGLLQAIGGRSALVKGKKTNENCVAVIKRRMRKSESYQALARKTDEDHLAGKSRQKAVVVRGR